MVYLLKNEIDGLPILKMVDLPMAMLNNHIENGHRNSGFAQL
jgi:hypothetical protein